MNRLLSLQSVVATAGDWCRKSLFGICFRLFHLSFSCVNLLLLTPYNVREILVNFVHLMHAPIDIANRSLIISLWTLFVNPLVSTVLTWRRPNIHELKMQLVTGGVRFFDFSFPERNGVTIWSVCLCEIQTSIFRFFDLFFFDRNGP
jgi:hypothetical protein